MMLEFKPEHEQATWAKVQWYVVLFGMIIGSMALGAIGQSIIDKAAKLPWLHQQAATVVVYQKSVIPALKAQAGCEHERADKATDLAASAIAAIRTNSDNGPSPSAIPEDNCPHPAAKK